MQNQWSSEKFEGKIQNFPLPLGQAGGSIGGQGAEEGGGGGNTILLLWPKEMKEDDQPVNLALRVTG